jgi:uncharacterized protein with GYD domain
MAKFLIHGSYTAQGAKGLIKEGGSGRKAAIEKALQDVGGTLDAIYWAFGSDDLIMICDLPDTASGLAFAMAGGSSGSLKLTTTPLLSVEDVDAACKKAVTYRPAGA